MGSSPALSIPPHRLSTARETYPQAGKKAKKKCDSPRLIGRKGVKLLAKSVPRPKARLFDRQQTTTIILIYNDGRKKGRVTGSPKQLLATLRGVRQERHALRLMRQAGRYQIGREAGRERVCPEV